MNSIEKISIYGSSSIGVFIFTSETFSFIPPDINPKKIEIIESTLNTKVFSTTIMNSKLLGVFVAGNSKGILLPKLVSEEEINFLKKHLENNINIDIIDNKVTALGNLILANDHAAIISPYLSTFSKKIEEILDVEVMVKDIGGSPLVGAMALVTNKGGLIHPMIPDVEIDFLKNFFRVNMNVGTINRGYPYIKVGMVANSKGALIGMDTTGPEIMRIMATLFH